MRELIAQSIPDLEADVCAEPERICERASESPLLGGSAPVKTNTLTNTWKRLSHLGIEGEQECMSVCIPPHTAAIGPMSLMQFWTKLYSQLGRPLPKVLVLFAYFLPYVVLSIVLSEG